MQDEETKRRELQTKRESHPPAPMKLGNYYDNEQHDKYRQKLQDERRLDYQHQVVKVGQGRVDKY